MAGAVKTLRLSLVVTFVAAVAVLALLSFGSGARGPVRSDARHIEGYFHVDWEGWPPLSGFYVISGVRTQIPSQVFGHPAGSWSSKKFVVSPTDTFYLAVAQTSHDLTFISIVVNDKPVASDSNRLRWHSDLECHA